MGAGGIIHQRAAVMLIALNDSSLFDSLPQHCKDRVNAIDAKPFDQRDEHDVHVLAMMFPVAVSC